MSQQYQVLARKYRPKNFHELIGQSHVSKALINAIDHNRLHHAYLFTGTRGVGKTTIARILSKCLNCETGITSTPCGVCSSCVAIDQGRFIDLIEIDAASRTKVEDTRELIDNVPYAPTQGRFKVYLIDEVHMLSTHSFNALLKTLEEPPPHVKFLLATTDPQKLPITIISRCLQFVLRPLPQQAISEHIANLLTLEGINYTQPALWQLANAAKGSVRDALSLTDQAIAFGQGALTDETVNDMLGLIDNADLVQLLLDIYQGDTESVSAHIEQMRAQMVDAGSMFDGLAELLHQIAMVQLLPNVALNVNDVQIQQIKQLAITIGADVLQLYYQIIIQGREQIKLANTPLQALEMCLLRLLAFRPLAINEIPVPSKPDAITAEHNSTVDEDQSDLQSDSKSGNTNHFKDTDQFKDTDNLQLYDTSSDDLETEMPQSISVDTKDSNDAHVLLDLKTQTESHDQDLIVQHSIVQDSIVQESIVQGINESQNTITQLEKPFVDVRDNDVIHTDTDTDTDTDTLKDMDNGLASQINKDSGSSDTILADTFSLNTSCSNSLENNKLADVTIEPQALLDANVSDVEPDNQSIILSTNIKEQGNVKEQNKVKVQDEVKVQDNIKVESNVIDKLSADDPRALLKCVPIELVGEWTPEKWDYWLQSARESGKLGSDQLAMARQGVMTGKISGKCVFKVAFDTKNMQSIFNHLSTYLNDQFGAEVSIEVDSSLKSDNLDLLPQNRQLMREELAKNQAKEMLIQSPVLQRLIHDYKGEIVNLKLL